MQYEDEAPVSITPDSVHNLFPSTTMKEPRAASSSRESILKKLSESLLKQTLYSIDLSQRGLNTDDARLVKMAISSNRNLVSLKLGYNNLGDTGVSLICEAMSDRLESLDLGFNNISDTGAMELCRNISVKSQLKTLYLGGNLIRTDGAYAIADLIRRPRQLQKLYLMGNLLGPEGVRAIAESIIEDELQRRDFGGLQEVYLGDSGMGSDGCQAVAELLRKSRRIRVLSLPNCGIGDEELELLSDSIKSNENLPLESLQLSFNRITCRGIEKLSSALYSSNLRELLLDNNEIADRGAQQIATMLIPQVRTMQVLNVGFNQIKSSGIKLIMKAVADYSRLKTVSVAGNSMDVSAAKAVAYAMAFNRTLESLSLVHCDLEHESMRHITAGIVSNSRISLHQLAGFRLGPMVVTLGFPGDLEDWNNPQVLSFCHLMWKHHRKSSSGVCEEEKISDPLHFLNDTAGVRSTPEEATIVIEVAKKAYSTMVANGLDVMGRRNSGSSIASETKDEACPFVNRRSSTPFGKTSEFSMPARKVASFVARPEAHSPSRPDPARRRRLGEWFQENVRELNDLAEQPFNAGELWRLHQHYFSPVVNESGGESIAPSPNPSAASVDPTTVSVPAEVYRSSSSSEVPDGIMTDTSTLSGSHPFMKIPTAASSQPMMKRKVSYRCLGEAAAPRAPPQPVAMLIEGNLHSLPRKSKKARRNRTRISFLPRAKAKLDSYLDVSHDKALITMRQLRYVEEAVLEGRVHAIGEDDLRTHLCGALAHDAETILVDML